MSLANRILYRLSARCRCRVINGPDRKPYLERYFLARLPFGYRVYLHRFVASDPGRGLHDHPWRHALSILLSGSYRETRMLDARHGNALQQRRLGPGSVNFIGGDSFHRINLEPGRECWSLFLHAPTVKSWGFLRQRGYIDHEAALGEASNPLWWRQAPRPIQRPDMRLPCPLPPVAAAAEPLSAH